MMRWYIQQEMKGWAKECNPCQFGKIKPIMLIKFNFSTYIFLSKHCALLQYVKMTSKRPAFVFSIFPIFR